MNEKINPYFHPKWKVDYDGFLRSDLHDTIMGNLTAKEIDKDIFDGIIKELDDGKPINLITKIRKYLRYMWCGIIEGEYR